MRGWTRSPAGSTRTSTRTRADRPATRQSHVFSNSTVVIPPTGANLSRTGSRAGGRWYPAFVTEATWAVIAILAASVLGNLYWLGSKIDALGTRLDARIDGLDARLSARLDAMNARLDFINTRLDAHLDAHMG